MQITGTVVSTTTVKQIPKKSGVGSYEGWEVVYKDDNGELKTLQRPSQSLTQVPGLKEALAELSPDDKFVATLEKDGQFFKVTGLAKGELATPLPKSRGTWKGTPQQRDYETKEERAIRQRLIVRQSSLSNAIEYSNSVKAKNEETIFELAEKMYQWVMKEAN